MGTAPDDARELLPVVFFGYEEGKNTTEVGQTAIRRDFRPRPIPQDLSLPVKAEEIKAVDDIPKASPAITPVEGSDKDSTENPNPENQTFQSDNPEAPALVGKETKDPDLVVTSIG